MAADLIFPKNFLWGTATSSYQVEGKIKNDWSVWEKSRKRIKQLKKQGKNPAEFISGKACDHYHLYKKDFNLARSCGNNAHRFSIEWARIEPKQGKFDQKQINHYKNVIKALRQRHLEPFITLHHFTLPLWFADRGGWLNKKAAEYFEDYVSKIVNLFSDVKFWVTINEPMVISESYWRGGWPHKIKSKFKAIKATKNLIKSHKKAYKVIHELSDKKVGIAKNMTYFQGLPLFLKNKYYNWYFLDKIKKEQDFIGLNYYTRECSPQTKNKSFTDDWERDIYPQGIYFLLKRLRRYNLPIYITENGIVDKQDKRRPKFIIQHLKQVNRAIKEKSDVRGYFYWSLLDNFEWRQGFKPRFGLVNVDYKTLRRIPRKSFYIYRQICESNKISKELQKKYL